MDLPSRIKRLRAQRQLSLRALAERTGFSASFLSQVELGQASPSLASLGKLAEALGSSLSDLVADELPAEEPVVRRKDSAGIRSQWSKASVQSLLPAKTQEPIGAVLVTIEAGGRSGKIAAPAVGKEFAFCVRGSVRLTLAGRQFELGEGDSIYLDARQPLLWENVKTKKAELLLVMVRDSAA